LADGSPNPVHRPVRYQADPQAGTIRVRKLCCLYYLLPGTELCGDCPRLHPHCARRHVPTRPGGLLSP
jgi:ferric iron reductase protein FhuF